VLSFRAAAKAVLLQLIRSSAGSRIVNAASELRSGVPAESRSLPGIGRPWWGQIHSHRERVRADQPCSSRIKDFALIDSRPNASCPTILVVSRSPVPLKSPASARSRESVHEAGVDRAVIHQFFTNDKLTRNFFLPAYLQSPIKTPLTQITGRGHRWLSKDHRGQDFWFVQCGWAYYHSTVNTGS